VPIRDCTVIAVEGTHASGKTTLVHALVSYYRERGIHATCVDEPARSSPFMEDIVLRGQGTFDVIAEPRHVRCPAHHPAPGGPPPQRPGRRPRRRSTSWPTRGRLPAQDAPVIDAMLALCGATAGLYDAVLYATDTF